MQISTQAIGDIAIIALTGRLTVTESPGLLKEAVRTAVAGGAKHVIIDLSDVHYIDSTRLGELIAAHVTVSRQGGRLKLAGTPERIIDLFEIAGLADVFERFDSVDTAIASLA